MKKRILLPLIVAAVALGLPGSSTPAAEAQAARNVELRIATLAPDGSSWMRVFNAWNQSLQEATGDATGGRVSLRLYPGGSQGDERDFIRKMRDGQLDGAAVTTTGLGQVARSTLVLAVPGVITEYAQMDRVRSRLNRQLLQGFTEGNVTLLGWGDVGKSRLFSTQSISRPSDIRSTRPWHWRDEPIFGEFLSVVGATPVQLGVNEVYPSLQTGVVNTVPASALAAVSLQWHTRLRFVTQQNSGLIVGATIINKSAFDALTEGQRAALTSTADRAHSALRRAIRRDDDRAYQTVLRRGITEVDISAHQAEWATAQATTRQRLTGRLYSAALLRSVEAAAAPR
ncbi:MAG: TRAP transporter substrate-binding protein DctP [Sandaracinaceae bacterium]|nr:TRAP transporter substrate-binding protein DctP [Sandaracinaceae bacterium]